MCSHSKSLRLLLLIGWGITTGCGGSSTPEGRSTKRPTREEDKQQAQSQLPIDLPSILNDKSTELPEKLINALTGERELKDALRAVQKGTRAVDDVLNDLTLLHHLIIKAAAPDPECQHASVRMLKRLLNKGANADQKDKHGRAPIHLATGYSGRVDCAKILVARGAALNVVGGPPGYETPLQQCVFNAAIGSTEDENHKKHFEILNIILDGGADPTLTGPERNRTPLQIVEQESKGANNTKVSDRLKRAITDWQKKHSS